MRITRYLVPLALLATAGLRPPGVSGAALPNGGWDAAWSPDGKRIAFTSGSPHGIPNLWVIGADKSGLKPMTTRGAHDPHWLPDGKTIVFGTLRSGAALYMSIDADGAPGSEKKLDVLPIGAEEPVWSPDGALVAYGAPSKTEGMRDLWFARSSGGGATALTTNFYCRDWAWSPDGSALAFVVGRATGTSIWTVDVASKDVRLVYKGYCRAPAYSPDGKKLAFAVPDVNSGFHIVLVDLASGTEKPIAVQSFNGKKIIWSPDGRRMFISSSRKAEPAVWSVGADGTGLTRVTPQGLPSEAPALSPDGARIACHVSRANSYGPELAVFNTAGRLLTTLTASSSASYWSPTWSPDGREIAFQSDVRHKAELFVGSPAARTAKALAPLNSAAEVSWFPNGKTLLLADAGRILLVTRSAGKDAVKPLPKLTTRVQGGRLHGNEVILTQWGIRNAALAAVKLDGTVNRALTQKPVPVPAKVEDARPDAPKPQTTKPGPSTLESPAPEPRSQTNAQPTTGHHARFDSSRDGGTGRDGMFVTLASNRHNTVAAVRTVADTIMLDPPAGSGAPSSPMGNPHGGTASPHGGMGSPHGGAASPHGAMDTGQPEMGNPHAELGLMGPQANLAKNEAPPVIDLWPAVSPNQKSVAFARNDQIWVVGLDGTGERQLTNLAPPEKGVRTVAGPSWSPDGATILFAAFTVAPAEMTLELWRCRAEGGSESLVYSEDVDTEYGSFYFDCTSAPVFLPDGQRVLFTSLATGEPRIVSVALDGSDLREVVPAPSSFPALDPTGRKLAYVDLGSFQERIRVMDLATGNRTGFLFAK